MNSLTTPAVQTPLNTNLTRQSLPQTNPTYFSGKSKSPLIYSAGALPTPHSSHPLFSQKQPKIYYQA